MSDAVSARRETHPPQGAALVVQSIEANLKPEDVKRCLPSAKGDSLASFQQAVLDGWSLLSSGLRPELIAGPVVALELGGSDSREAAEFAINTLSESSFRAFWTHGPPERTPSCS
jgi:hypothetical protein